MTPDQELTDLHPSAQELTDYGLGRLAPASADRVYHHLEECPSCLAQVEALADDPLADLVRAAMPPADPNKTLTILPNTNPEQCDVPADRDVLEGHTRYQILNLLGAGGMGAVYKARDLVMERTVALKVLQRKLTDMPAAAERFRREVKAAAALAHPNIVTAHDAGLAGGKHFLVMEFVPGITLTQLVAEQGPLGPGRACDYVRQAAIGLQHAHERGLVHRDLKPGNLILTPDSLVKILDLGLARFCDEHSGELTDSKAVMGTADFMAPEQADDPRHADIRADIYSLGCTLYYLLSGRPPFSKGTLLEKIQAHAERTPPSLSAAGVPLPAGLESVLGRMLAKDPRQRYQTPAALADALAPFARESQPRARSRRRLLVVSSAAALVAVVVGVALLILNRGDAPSPHANLGPERPALNNPASKDVKEDKKAGDKNDLTPQPSTKDKPASIVNASLAVTAVTLRADPDNYTGPAPADILFRGKITANGPGTASYRFLRSDNSRGPVFTVTFEKAGVKEVSTTWRLGRNFQGWQVLTVLTPNEIVSDRARFKVEFSK